MFERAERVAEGWMVYDAWGNGMLLPVRKELAGTRISFGVLGHGTRLKPKKIKVYDATADMLRTLKKPVYLLDTRRTGGGGSGSWSPKELATAIPTTMRSPFPYAFLHLPCLAPSAALLWTDPAGTKPRVMPWLAFRDQYKVELTDDARNVAQAFVESAASAGGIAMFLCAEAFQPGFTTLSLAEQDQHYCHRFTLAGCIAERLKAQNANATVELLQIDLTDFLAAGASYAPSSFLF